MQVKSHLKDRCMLAGKGKLDQWLLALPRLQCQLQPDSEIYIQARPHASYVDLKTMSLLG